MNQEIVNKMLELERSAERIVHAASEEASAIIATADQAAEEKKADIMKHAQAEAAQIIAESKANAEANRAVVLRQAEDQANDVKNEATQNISHAVTYILDQILPSI